MDLLKLPHLGIPRAVRLAPRYTRISCSASRLHSGEKDVQKAKMNLLNAIVDTDRGFRTTPEQRAHLEESMVEVEKYDAVAALDLNKLDGTWLLQYTSAPDVVSILQAGSFPFFKAGQIYQKFECSGSLDGGTVLNVVKWSIPGVLQDADGATLIVTAGFSIVSARTIQLEFKQARVGEVSISEEFQALLAPAVLPRTFINLEILQALRSLDITIPLQGTPVNTRRQIAGLLYYLTYLDSNMLIGRALGNGGVFVFSRTQSLN